mmetsp:Transcript_21545/g.36973  ORF Transcript_21545/g.36973 Transcript_21545/m.36973 type:complete len:137 (+) Transcript_21545:53-463(+)|eukprot:CAMPEP_0196656748 /NCGR_PEP_ID=MMETSP1086-20130531/19419_1 /TAXON_ID=77921 /ORGANISM="Cyanoptyche  gloeocystis , Strain SAG4.97" /LENGTH=136 /DNA_ID=CAMNT_0041989611 /DNA_START=53 /DNA_END=463 /DNA_ORIENTATION=-
MTKHHEVTESNDHEHLKKALFSLTFDGIAVPDSTTNGLELPIEAFSGELADSPLFDQKGNLRSPVHLAVQKEHVDKIVARLNEHKLHAKILHRDGPKDDVHWHEHTHHTQHSHVHGPEVMDGSCTVEVSSGFAESS